MSVIIKGMGTNVLTKGFGSFVFGPVYREVLRLYSKISKVLRLDSKWKKTYSS